MFVYGNLCRKLAITYTHQKANKKQTQKATQTQTKNTKISMKKLHKIYITFNKILVILLVLWYNK